MLVLSRKLGEKIVIGEGIELMVVAVNGNRVKLGIAAPQSCRIVRSECRDKAPALHEIEVEEELLASC
jgi:carbon storage regulator CsrA